MFLSQVTGRKQQINLGGQRHKEEDRNRFLQRTEQERRARLLEKKRNSSATLIQSFYRARCALQKRKEEERNDWVQKMNKLALLPPALASAVPIFFPLLRQFLFFYSATKDAEHFVRVSKLILMSCQNKEPANYFCAALNQQTQAGWLVETKRFARASVQRLSLEVDDVQNPGMSLRLLTLLCNPAAWPVGSNENEKKSLCSRILADLISHGFFEEIQNALDRVLQGSLATSKQGKEALMGLVSLALIPFGNLALVGSPSLSLASRQFTRKILTIPHLVEQLPSVLIQSLVASLPHSLLTTTDDFLEVKDAKKILDNLLQLINPTIQKQNVEISTAFLEAISKLLCFFTRISDAKKSKRKATSRERDNMDIEESAPTECEDDERENPLLERVSGLLRPFILLNLLKLFLPAEPPPNNSVPFSVVFPRGLASLCQLCNSLLAWEHPMRLPVLNCLAHTVTTNLWYLLESTGEFNQFVDKGYTGPIDDVSSILGLFSVCYSHLLASMDDEEFFKKQSCFLLNQVLSISATLKKIVFRMHWFKGTQGIYQNRRLRKAITDLLQKLYDRNSRHVYADESHWTATEVALDTDHFELNVTSQEKGKERRILKHIPFLVPATTRFRLFAHFIRDDKDQVEANRHWGYSTRIAIRRDSVFEDGYSTLAALPVEKLKSVIKVSFVNSEGLEEAGIDGGGVFKEFLTELSKEAFGPEYGLFLETSERLLYPNPSSHQASEDHLSHFEFLGRVIGKAMYEGILVEVPFANFFLAKLLSKFNYYNDLVFLDPELHRNLMTLKYYQGNVEEDFALNFTVTNNNFGAVEVVELVPGGREIAVTNDNRMEYIHRMAHYRLNTQIKRQCMAFLKGFSALIKPEWLRMFNQHELHLLIAGHQGGIDLVDLREHVHYGGGYRNDHPTIKLLWEVLETFSVEDQHLFLKFVTSCSRPPLLGFGQLNPPFAIHKAGGTDRTREHLPTASTCMNLLKLYPYKDAETLRQKLLYAIHSAAGFELS